MKVKMKVVYCLLFIVCFNFGFYNQSLAKRVKLSGKGSVSITKRGQIAKYTLSFAGENYEVFITKQGLKVKNSSGKEIFLPASKKIVPKKINLKQKLKIEPVKKTEECLEYNQEEKNTILQSDVPSFESSSFVEEENKSEGGIDFTPLYDMRCPNPSDLRGYPNCLN